ncbi:MAG: PEP-CTERM sorting domain-containing protein [Cyanobacteriota bacterium]|nr:PEP-CTERM sorting domain-containing protein [Cyanobacteriota bacterium]
MSLTNLLSSSIKETATRLGVVGLSAIALFGAPEAAKAATINAGTDYLFTPAGGTWVDFDEEGPMDRVFFEGVPVLPGGTDTAVKRLDDCNFDSTGKCTVGLQFESLNLTSVAPVAEFGDRTVFLMLDDSQGDQPITTMELMQVGENMATWTNTLEFNWKLVDSLTDPEANVLAQGQEFFNGNGKGTFNPDGDFIVLEYDDSAAWARHTDKIPEPSMVLASIFGLGGMLGLKRKKESDS